MRSDSLISYQHVFIITVHRRGRSAVCPADPKKGRVLLSVQSADATARSSGQRARDHALLLPALAALTLAGWFARAPATARVAAGRARRVLCKPPAQPSALACLNNSHRGAPVGQYACDLGWAPTARSPPARRLLGQRRLPEPSPLRRGAGSTARARGAGRLRRPRRRHDGVCYRRGLRRRRLRDRRARPAARATAGARTTRASATPGGRAPTARRRRAPTTTATAPATTARASASGGSARGGAPRCQLRAVLGPRPVHRRAVRVLRGVDRPRLLGRRCPDILGQRQVLQRDVRLRRQLHRRVVLSAPAPTAAGRTASASATRTASARPAGRGGTARCARATTRAARTATATTPPACATPAGTAPTA